MWVAQALGKEEVNTARLSGPAGENTTCPCLTKAFLT
jgi:hypothetical protein